MSVYNESIEEIFNYKVYNNFIVKNNRRNTMYLFKSSREFLLAINLLYNVYGPFYFDPIIIRPLYEKLNKKLKNNKHYYFMCLGQKRIASGSYSGLPDMNHINNSFSDLISIVHKLRRKNKEKIIHKYLELDVMTLYAKMMEEISSYKENW